LRDEAEPLQRPGDISGPRRARLRSAGEVLLFRRAGRGRRAPVLICLAAWLMLSLILWAGVFLVVQQARAL
jgi:hypothetical protein